VGVCAGLDFKWNFAYSSVRRTICPCVLVDERLERNRTIGATSTINVDPKRQHKRCHSWIFLPSCDCSEGRVVAVVGLRVANNNPRVNHVNESERKKYCHHCEDEDGDYDATKIAPAPLVAGSPEIGEREKIGVANKGLNHENIDNMIEP